MTFVPQKAGFACRSHAIGQRDLVRTGSHKNHRLTANPRGAGRGDLDVWVSNPAAYFRTISVKG